MNRGTSPEEAIRAWVGRNPEQVAGAFAELLIHYFVGSKGKDGDTRLDLERQPSPADTDQLIVELLGRTSFHQDLARLGQY